MKAIKVNNEAVWYQVKQSLHKVLFPTGKIKLCTHFKNQENRSIMESKRRFRLFPFHFFRNKKNQGIESEQLYQTLFLNAPIPVWITDRKTLKILEVNQAAIRFYGLDRENFLGKTAFDIMDHIDVSVLDPSEQSFDNHLVIRTGYINSSSEYVWIDLLINNVYFKEREVYLIAHAVV